MDKHSQESPLQKYLGGKVLIVLNRVRKINHPRLRKLVGFVVAVFLILIALPFYLLSKSWIRIGLYVLIAYLTGFILNREPIDWQQVQNRAWDWAGIGALLGALANLPYFLWQRFSNTGNLLVDLTVSAIDEVRSSDKSEYEKTWQPFVIMLGLGIIGGILGATRVLINVIRFPNVLLVIALACLDLTVTAMQRKKNKL